MNNNKNIKGKNILITGSYGGLGKEIANAFAINGCNLLLTGKSNLKLKKLKQELSDYNVNVEILAADLKIDQDINNLISQSLKIYESIDILINCAGIFPVKSIVESTIEDFDDCFSVNIRAPFILSKKLSESMINNKWGRIVNIGSSSSYQGFKETSIYCSSKHALLGLSRSLFDELKEKNVGVFCISPGSIKTKMGSLVKNQDFETFLNPKEIAEYIIFIISYDSELISEEIRINRKIIK